VFYWRTGWNTWRVAETLTGTSHTQRGLSAGVQYYFMVRARGDGVTYFNSYGNASSSVSATPTRPVTFTVFNFSPNPIYAGGTSNVWTVQNGVSSVYMDVDYAVGSRKDSSGGINVQVLNSSNRVTSTVVVDNENDSGTLSGVSAGSRIRVMLENDAWDQHASLVTLTFHSGSSDSAPVIARATLQKERELSRPEENGSPTIENTRSGAVTLHWSRGTEYAGQRPDHYLLVIPGASGTYSSGLKVADAADVDHRISSARSRNLEGTHTASVRHCNAAGGCSDALPITFTLPAYVPPPPPGDVFNFSPNPIYAGGTSNVWTVPSSVSSVYLDVDYAIGQNKDLTGVINVQVLDSRNRVTSTVEVNNENDSTTLSGVSRGSRVRVMLENDAWDLHASSVTLTFHSGTSDSGAEIAKAVVQKERRPSQVPPDGDPTVNNMCPGTVTLHWKRGTVHAGQRPDHYRVVIPNPTNRNAAPLYQNLNVSDANDPVSLPIRASRDNGLEGTHTARVSHCNAAGGCSLPTSISFTMPKCTTGPQPRPVFNFSPNPIRAGGTSTVWTVPSGVSSVYLDVDYATGSIKDSSGGINVQVLDSRNRPTSTVAVGSEGDSGTLDDVRAGSRVRVMLENDAWDQDASLVTLTFHSGASATGPAIARATLQKERELSRPVANGSPTIENTRSGAVTLHWSRGREYAGQRPDHYLLVIPGASGAYSSGLKVADADDVDHRISSARSRNVDGTHTASVRHCNAAGGCSDALSITFTLPAFVTSPPPTRPIPPTMVPSPPPPTNMQLGIHGSRWDALSLTYSNSSWSRSNDHYYQFQLQQRSGSSWSAVGTQVVGTDASTTVVVNFPNQRGDTETFRVFGQRCTNSGYTVCGNFATSATFVLPARPPAPKPESLAVDPRVAGTLNATFRTQSWSWQNAPPGHFYQLQLREPSTGTVVDTVDVSLANPGTISEGFTNVPSNKEYQTRGRRCTYDTNGVYTRCGPWGASVGMPPPPVITRLAPHATSKTAANLTYTSGNLPGVNSSIHQFEREKHDGTNWVSPAIRHSGRSPHVLTGLDEGGRYRVHGRRCLDLTSNFCGYWSPHSEITLNKLQKPEVTVMPVAAGTTPGQREVTIEWPNDPLASNYRVNTTTVGATNLAPVLVGATYSANLRLEDELDTMSAEYSFEVVAENPGSNYADSEPAKVKIVRDPIKRADGDSRNVTGGQAAITWHAQPGGSNFWVWYWQLGHNDDEQVWSGHDDFISEQKSKANTNTAHTVGGLTQKSVYALQLRWTEGDTEVFSGTFSYVWPHDDFPKRGLGDQGRVASYPSFGHWPNRTYTYRFCADTFDPFQAEWSHAINEAFNTWGAATDGYVNIVRSPDACTVGDLRRGPTWLKMTNMVATSLNVNEVYMVNDDDWSFLHKLNLLLFIDDLQGICGLTTPSGCAISRAYGPTQSAKTELSNAAGSKNAVDILFRGSKFSMGGTFVRPTDTYFNQCDGARDTNVHHSYTTALHEAGHALGLSGRLIVAPNDLYDDIAWAVFTRNEQRLAELFNDIGKNSLYEGGHPSVPMAVMNYDHVPGASGEPDCYPHAFDVMAVWAVYQTVK